MTAPGPDPTDDPVGTISYSLHQSLRYEYLGPIRHLAHRLMVVPPPVHGDQRRTTHQLEVRDAPAGVTERVDGYGNHVVDVTAARVEEAIEFDVHVGVERRRAPVAATVPIADLSDGRFLLPSPLTRPDDRLRQQARALLAGPGGRVLGERICAWTNSALVYDGDATDVWTTAAGALAVGRGVCQDYAHLMLALSRLCRLPARYVSGHLRGEGGTHAWVEVLVPAEGRAGGAEAMALDPTHARAPGVGYVTVAVGRDYGDVAPTSGTYDAPWPGRLSIHKELTEDRLELAPS